MSGKKYILEILMVTCFIIASIEVFSEESLFSDNFDAGKLNSEWKIDKQDGWEIKDGCLFNKAGKGSGSIRLNLKQKGSWIFSCTVKKSPANLKYPGINISFMEKGVYEYYTLHIKPFEKHEKAFYYIWEMNKSKKKVVGFSFFPVLGLKFNFNEVHKLAVSFGKDQILRFYWDDTLVLEKSNIFLRPDTIRISGSAGSDLYIDDVMVKEETSSMGREKILLESDFSDIGSLLLSGHENYKDKKAIDGNEVTAGTEEKSVKLKYNFRTEGHDSFMLTKDIKVEKADYFSLKIKGDGSKHKVFFVLTDASGENHYLLSHSLKCTNWVDLNICLTEYLKLPFPKEMKGISWGGDGNQKIDFPIKKLTVGVNDSPDTFIGKGEIELGEFTFFITREIND